MKTIKMQMLGNRTIELSFSDATQAKDTYDVLKNIMVFQGQPIKAIEYQG